MNKDELKIIIPELDESTNIIVVNTNEEAQNVPREVIMECERIKVGDLILILGRKLGRIVNVWVIAIALLAVIAPMQPKAIKLTPEQIEPLIGQIDKSFPYFENNRKFPFLSYDIQIASCEGGQKYDIEMEIPPSGFLDSVISKNTGISPS